MAILYDNLDIALDDWSANSTDQPSFDNNNQIVFYTGMFRHQDGTIHDEPETEVHNIELSYYSTDRDAAHFLCTCGETDCEQTSLV